MFPNPNVCKQLDSISMEHLFVRSKPYATTRCGVRFNER
jgi:hypothetical protein